MFSKLSSASMIAAAAAAALVFGATGVLAQEATPAPEIDNFVSTKTRAQVIAETRDAARSGLIARNEADEQRIAAFGFVSLKTRGQVVAETVEARRLGLTTYGEAGEPTATPAQLESIRIAGLRALDRVAGK
jgi:hypothetical protein